MSGPVTTASGWLLAVRPLEAEAFAPYGTVVESAQDGRWINDGNAWRSEAGQLELDAEGGCATLAVFRARGRAAAGPWHELERHRLGTQSFLPLGPARCVLLVALGTSAPEPASLAAFITRPGQGWTLDAGTWHHGLIVLEDTDVAVVERQGPAPDCDIVHLAEPVTLTLPT
jgi:ureidoglycolate lyase